jgi:SAM-dependent methyltransferase
MDFTRLLPDGPFDLVVDRASLPHNTTEAIARCIRMIEKRLRPGGWFIGVDWFSTDDTARERFADLGTVTFFTSQDIETLLHETRWEIVHLDQVRRETLGTGRLVSTFNFAARLR